MLAGFQSALLSVVIPCYKQGHLLRYALDSTLAQGDGVEAIVVDDGSPDDTRAVVAMYGGRVRYIRKRNGGLSSARNAGIRVATGEYSLFLDADDWLLPGLLDQLKEAIAAEGLADILWAGWHSADFDGHITERHAAPSVHENIFHALLDTNLAPCHCHVVHRRVIERVGLFDESLGAHEDWDYWLRAAGAGFRFVTMPGAFAVYRRYAGSMSDHLDRMDVTRYQVLLKHRRTHRNCPDCRAKLAKALRWHREWFYETKVKQPFSGGLNATNARAVTAAILRQAIDDPGWIPILLHHTAGFAVRQLGILS